MSRAFTRAAAALALTLRLGSLQAAPEVEGAATAPGDPVMEQHGVQPELEPTEPPTAPAPVHAVTAPLVALTMNFLGVPYRRGGSSALEGFDCSGFTRHVFEQGIGLVLPRRSHDQATRAGLAPVRREHLRAGDLVFFNTLRRTFSHVGIYVGDGHFVHAPARGGAVRIEDMRSAYWNRRFNGGRRAPVESPAVTAAPGSLAAPAQP